MKRFTIRPLSVVTGMVILAATALITPENFCAADDRLWFVPEEHPGPPYYMVLAEHESQDLVPLILIRDPDCIPDDFNLLRIVHVGPGGAHSCPLNVEGFRIAPQFTGPPTLLHLQNPIDDVVPIWFVSRAEYLDEIVDGELFIGEIELMETLTKGAAIQYEETQSVLATLPKAHVIADGLLEDGRTFRLHLEEHVVDGVNEVVRYDIVISD